MSKKVGLFLCPKGGGYANGIQNATLAKIDEAGKKLQNIGSSVENVGKKFLPVTAAVSSNVCTDSFHGTAFSILNEKQFVVFNRYAENSSFSKNSRIDTLCVNFGLESRRYKNGMDLSDVVKDDIDYKAVGEKYKNLKMVTDQYLKTVWTLQTLAYWIKSSSGFMTRTFLAKFCQKPSLKVVLV